MLIYVSSTLNILKTVEKLLTLYLKFVDKVIQV